MRKTKAALITAALAFSFCTQAQSIDEAKKLVQYERYTSARSMLQTMANTDPLANYYLGLSELGQGNIETARQIFGKYPGDAANMAGMARINFQTGNKADGLRLAQSVAGMAKKKEVMPLVWAADAVNYGGGDVQQAIDWYKKALEKMDNVDIRIGLGDAFQKMQSGGGEAMNNYEKAVTMDPKNSLGYSRIGQLWYDAHNYNDALTNFQKAKDADPSNPLPYNLLANAYYWVGKYDLALENIKKYMELSDKTVEDEVRYGDFLYLAKKYPEVIEHVNNLIQKGQTQPRFFGILAYSQLETHDSLNALTNVRKYFAGQDPKKIGAFDYMRYGRILQVNSMEDSAEYYFNKAITIDTARDKSETYRQIAEGYKNLKTETGYSKAGSYYARLVTENPNAQALDYFYWGFWNFYGKNYEEAMKGFKAMQAKYPDQPSALYWQGRVGAALDPGAKNGTAEQAYLQWLATPNTDKSTKKDADLMNAYQYLTNYYYNKGDKAKTAQYNAEVLRIEPANTFGKQIEEALKKMK